MGPLTVCKENPRYFSGRNGEPVFLAGFHTWSNLVDIGRSDPPMPFEYEQYLNELTRLNHNFIRLWAWDMLCTWDARDVVGQFPWKRTGPAVAKDGKPAFDLEQFDEGYLKRLHDRVAGARDKGIYACVMLFDSWATLLANNTPIDMHCFAGGNNVNGVDILANRRDGCLRDWTTLDNPRVTALQKKYIRAVVDTLRDMDNVLYEISNEAGTLSHDWQEHLADYVHDLEKGRGLRHPVGITGGCGTSNGRLWMSNADFVAPECNAMDGYAPQYMQGNYTFGEAPFDRGDRPVVLDTDHLWGIGGSLDWAWRSFCRGYNLLYMDRVDDFPSKFYEHPWWNGPQHRTDLDLRAGLGAIVSVSRRLALARCMPQNGMASSTYCLADIGAEYLIYAPDENGVGVLLPSGKYSFQWYDLLTGETFDEGRAEQGGRCWINNKKKRPGALHIVRSHP